MLSKLGVASTSIELCSNCSSLSSVDVVLGGDMQSTYTNWTCGAEVDSDPCSGEWHFNG